MWDGPEAEEACSAFQEDLAALEALARRLEKLSDYEVMARREYESGERKVSAIVAEIRV